MSGLGIAGFLKHSNDSGGRGQWLREWRKNGKGEVTIWLHTRAPIVPAFTHQIPVLDEYTDKETGKTVPVLRWPRFASPDPEIVHRNQFFREDDGRMRVPPDRDAFLLLREWLRRAEHIGLEDPVFQWLSPKDRRTIVWTRGELSGLVKRGKGNYGNSLDTKVEYVYVVVDHADVEQGPVLMREGKLLSQKIAEVIKQQQKQWGDEQGDPLQHPYAFLLVAEDAATPLNAYKAFKAERAEFTDEVWAAISGDEYPDPTKFGEGQDGDNEKIRDAMEAAAQVELPLDELFSDEPDVRKALWSGGHRKVGSSPHKAAAALNGAPAPRRAVPPPEPAAAPQRRKKVAPAPDAAEVPEPKLERIPCDDCGHLMLPTDATCEGCGAEYEPIEAPHQASAPKPAASAPKPAASAPKPAATSRKPAASAPKPATAAASKQGGKAGAVARTRTKAASAPIVEEVDEQAAATECWSCSAPLNGQTTCPACGIDQGDDIPF